MIKNKTATYIGLAVISLIIVLVVKVFLPNIQRYDEEYLRIHNEIASGFKTQMNYETIFTTENNKLQDLYEAMVRDGAEDIHHAEKQISVAEELIANSKGIINTDRTLVENQLLQIKESGELLEKIKKQKENQADPLLTLHVSLIDLLNIYHQALDEYDEILSLEQQIYTVMKEEKEIKDMVKIIDEVNQSTNLLSNTIKDLNAHIKTYNKIQI